MKNNNNFFERNVSRKWVAGSFLMDNEWLECFPLNDSLICGGQRKKDEKIRKREKERLKDKRKRKAEKKSHNEHKEIDKDAGHSGLVVWFVMC